MTTEDREFLDDCKAMRQFYISKYDFLDAQNNRQLNNEKRYLEELNQKHSHGYNNSDLKKYD